MDDSLIMNEKNFHPTKPLHKISTSAEKICKLSKKELNKELHSLGKELDDLQEVLYAESKHKVLIVLQGLDTSGKDGTVKHVFRMLNPQGIRVVSFKKPTALEASHDYLWRTHRETPQTGELVLFNRSHYEDYIVPSVHKGLPKAQLKKRLKEIVHFEDMLTSEGVTLIKMFLHISPEEQAVRIQARLNSPDKHWKFSYSDLAEREYWDDYLESYDEAFEATHKPKCPWYIIPADDKPTRNYLISTILVHHLRELKCEFPKIDDKMINKLKEEAHQILHTPKGAR